MVFTDLHTITRIVPCVVAGALQHEGGPVHAAEHFVGGQDSEKISAPETSPFDGSEDKQVYCKFCHDGPFGKWQKYCPSCHRQQ
jgi:hypothetical protein